MTELPPVLLPYQSRFLADPAQVIVVEKGRRIGMTWAAAYGAVEHAVASKAAHGMDVLYVGYALHMTRDFIADCAGWARQLARFANASPEVEEFVFTDRASDGDKDIQAFRIVFASGFEIVALSSRPRSLRGKQGLVIIDEAAFHDDLPALMKAAMAFRVWGGKIWVISTHDGADNPFNELVEDIRAGRKPYRLVRATFRDAVAEGLYRRVCLTQDREWSAAAEAEWVDGIYAEHGEAAAEELDCLPSSGSGVWLTRALIDSCAVPGTVVYRAFADGFELQRDVIRRAEMAALIEDRIDPHLEQLDEFGVCYLGADFARSEDLTVIVVGHMARGSSILRVPLVVELRNCPFAEQEQLLLHVLGRVPRLAGAALDARGLGAQLSERAVQHFGAARVERVLATREWYRETMPGLKARFEDRTIQIPSDPDLSHDLRAIKVDKGVAMLPEGSRTKGIRDGKQRHADAAIALALLHRATMTGGVAVYEYTPVSKAENGAFDQWRAGDRRSATRMIY